MLKLSRYYLQYFCPKSKNPKKNVILFNSCGDYGRRYLSSFHLVPLWQMFTRCDFVLWVHFFGISLNIFYLFVATGGLNFEPMLGKYLILLIINILIIIIMFYNWGITCCSVFLQRIRIKESSNFHYFKTPRENHEGKGCYKGEHSFTFVFSSKAWFIHHTIDIFNLFW